MGASASGPGSREPSPSVSAASGFDPSREHAWVSGSNGQKREVYAQKIGRLLVHENLNGDGFTVSHSGTGGVIVYASDRPTALARASRLEADHAAALDVLDLLDWGQNLTSKMRQHPAVEALAAYRASAIEAATAGETPKSGSTVGESAFRDSGDAQLGGPQ